MEPCAVESLIEDAVSEMDRFYGIRRSGEAISGRPLPKWHRRETPIFTTYRIMVRPFMEASGKRYVGSSTCLGESGVVLSYIAMNTPLEDAFPGMASAMEDMELSQGIYTNGFMWAYTHREKRRPCETTVIDLRPYYIEALDRKRFRVAVPADRYDLFRFSRMMEMDG
jgi:hypothetical protein